MDNKEGADNNIRRCRGCNQVTTKLGNYVCKVNGKLCRETGTCNSRK